MSRLLTFVSVICLSFSIFAFSISSKTEMKNGIRTTLCINGDCHVFEGALGAGIDDNRTIGDHYIIDVEYLNRSHRDFDWTLKKFLDQQQ